MPMVNGLASLISMASWLRFTLITSGGAVVSEEGKKVILNNLNPYRTFKVLWQQLD